MRYIDNIQDLLLNHSLLKSKPTDDVAILARARTLTALQGLDPDRKYLLIQFLYEAHLIGFVDSTGKPHDEIIDLFYADLSFAELSLAELRGANLEGVSLRNAILAFADLRGANLEHTDLLGTNFTLAELRGANLENAYLVGANLHYANLNGVDLHEAAYNTKLIQVSIIQGTPVYVGPTQWPQGFNPKVAGATCLDC